MDSPVPSTFNVPLPSHFSWFYHPSSIWWGTVFDCQVTLSVLAPCRTPSAYVPPPVWEQCSICDKVVYTYAC
jgi:hypothetical protein